MRLRFTIFDIKLTSMEHAKRMNSLKDKQPKQWASKQ